MKEFKQIAPQPQLGETCRKLREKNNLSVDDFATRYNLTRQTVYNFEKGYTESLKTLRAYIDLGQGVGVL